MIDPYAVFGLDKNANQEMIKQRWKSLIQQWHPDKFANCDDEDEKKQAEQKFAEIQESYKILGDPERRHLFDETGFIEPPENEIARSIETTLRTLITNFLSQGDRIFTIDVVKEITKYCDAATSEASLKVSKLKKKRVFLNKVARKFSRKKKLSRDFLNNIFLSEFNGLDQAINGQLKIILVMSQVKSVINAYEFDFMQVIEGPPDLSNPPNRVPLGNIFDLAGVNKK